MGMGGTGNTGGLHTEINITPLIDVVLVLLIIFLVTMPIMMKMVTMEVPRKIGADEVPDPAAGPPLVVKMLADLQIEFDDGSGKKNMKAAELPAVLRPLLERKLGEKVVFIDFENQVPWIEVVNTMDLIRSLSTDSNHEEVKVALKLRPDPNDPNAAPQ
jgi:biopolymer transport protein ExbD